MSFPKTARERGVVAPAKFAHCVLRTNQLPAMVDWYKNVLQAEAIFENPFACFMTYDEEHHRMAIVAAPGLVERPDHAVGLDHMAFTYENVSDLVHTYDRLKADGVTPGACIHHGPTLSMYYQDPDRNQVELQIDALSTREEFAAFVESDLFRKNPIGVVFDPDELSKKFHEGVPHAELIKPIEGPFPPPDVFPPH